MPDFVDSYASPYILAYILWHAIVNSFHAPFNHNTTILSNEVLMFQIPSLFYQTCKSIA